MYNINEVPTFEVGDKFKHIIADLEKMGNDIYNERIEKGYSMNVQLNPMRVHKQHNNSASLTWFQNQKTGVKFGMYIGMYPDGNPKWARIPVGEGIVLDLNKVYERKLAAFLFFHPKVKGTPFAVDDPLYYVIDQAAEAEREYEEANAIAKGISRASSWPSKNLPWLLRALDIPFEEAVGPRILRGHLFAYVRKDPIDFLKFISSKTREFTEVFKSARFFSIITQDPGHGFTFQAQPLGITETDVIVYLQNNPPITEAIINRINNLDLTKQQIEKLETEEIAEKDDY